MFSKADLKTLFKSHISEEPGETHSGRSFKGIINQGRSSNFVLCTNFSDQIGARNSWGLFAYSLLLSLTTKVLNKEKLYLLLQYH